MTKSALKITLDSNPSDASGCIKILASDGRDILIQTDWDFPGIATTFGWSTKQVQKCPNCGKIQIDVIDRGGAECFDCEDCDNPPGNDTHTSTITTCDHSHTDGTVDCKCGVAAHDFIQAARQWIDDNDGTEAEDPGYFE